MLSDMISKTFLANFPLGRLYLYYIEVSVISRLNRYLNDTDRLGESTGRSGVEVNVYLTRNSLSLGLGSLVIQVLATVLCL
jgi:hypothetical protein